MTAQQFAEPTVIILAITGLVQFIKQIPWLEDHPRWCPTVSAFFGILACMVSGVIFPHGHEMPEAIFAGLIYGLSASGFYSFANQFTKKDKNE